MSLKTILRNSDYFPSRRKSSAFIANSDPTEHKSLGDYDYGDSFDKFNDDALPKLENYRNAFSIQAAKRPTLDELHAAEECRKTKLEDQPSSPMHESSVKFGWIKGVFVRCVLNIWGVMLFLRLSWMVGESGIIQSLVIIALSSLVTIVTTLSMSAASTNGELKGGGLYYMISRSLGPEFGGAVGVVFSFANSAMAALNIVGNSEALISLLEQFNIRLIDGDVMDNRIYSVITLVILQSIIIIGMEWEAKAQMGLLVILLAAMLNFLIGAGMGPKSDLDKAKGWLGLNATTMMENMHSNYEPLGAGQPPVTFFYVFGVFFPSVSGIQAGVSISGDLKNPGEAIPKGTLLSIIVTSVSYALFAIVAGAGTVRVATGNVTDLIEGTFMNCTPVYACKYGLLNDYNVIGLMSLSGPLIYGGTYAACLSSALSCLISGPKTFQALCKDEVYPYMTKFGIGYRKSDDPFWGYALGFVIALIFILVGNLNAIAPLISNFFMVAYALLNFCTFHAEITRPLGWRPTFKYCNAWISSFGVLLCLVVMFLMSWIMAVLSLAVVFILYGIVLYRKPELNWGTTLQAQTYTYALSSLQGLVKIGDHAKNYRPQILCLSGFPSNRPALVDFANLITKGDSLLLCANVHEDRFASRFRNLYIQKGYEWLMERKIKSFYVMVDGCKFDEGCKALLQSAGIGKLRPNILLLGYKTNWSICHPSEVQEYFNCLHAALDNHLAIAILRSGTGLDVSDVFGHINYIVQNATTTVPQPANFVDSSTSLSIPEVSEPPKNSRELKEAEANASAQPQPSPSPSPKPFIRSTGGGGFPFANILESDATDLEAGNRKSKLGAAQKKGNKLIFPGTNTNNGPNKKNKDEVMGVYRGGKNAELDDDTPQQPPATDVAARMMTMGEPTLFQTKQGKGTIDVYWLYDDGGLTLLLPYIITMRKKWSQCQLRVFAIANKTSQAQLEYRSMASLLSKFRIDYSKLTLIPDITRRAHPQTKELFESLIQDYIVHENKGSEDAFIISEGELLGLKEKTNRHLRLRELLLEHSAQSNLIVMTLPVPRKGVVSAFLYMAWLEILTKDMPPFLLVRGNQASVLTFYS